MPFPLPRVFWCLACCLLPLLPLSGATQNLPGDSPDHEHPPAPDNLTPYRIIGDKRLNLHVFTPPPETTKAPRPALVMFFGGGWTKGSPAQFYRQARHLANRGMVVLLPEYRVASRDGTDPTACVADAKAAMRWVRDHAADWNLDQTRIAAGGGSAGGHLAAACAFVEGFEDTDRADDSHRVVPDALVLFNPVIDNGPEGYGYERVKQHFPAFSPLHNIGSSTPPPTLFLLGTEDNLIPVSTGYQFANRIRAAGGRCDLHLYEASGHGFFNHRDWGNLRFYETLRATERFLASLGWLDGAATGEIPPTARLQPQAEETVK